MGPGLTDLMLHEKPPKPRKPTPAPTPSPILLQPKKGVNQGVDVVEKGEDLVDLMTTPENCLRPIEPANPRWGIKTTQPRVTPRTRGQPKRPCCFQKLKFQNSHPEDQELAQIFPDPTKKLEFQSDSENQDPELLLPPATPSQEKTQRQLWKKVSPRTPPKEGSPTPPPSEKEHGKVTPSTPIAIPKKKEDPSYPNFEDITPQKENPTTEPARSVNSRPGTPVSRYQAQLSLFKEGEVTEV
jgi:hypothetical protein